MGLRARSWGAAPLALALTLVAGCAGGPSLSDSDDRLQVITTTGILRDIVHNVGSPYVSATSLVPDGADPHAYEPSLRDVRNVVYADVAFSNYMLLEEHAIIKTLDANLRDRVPNISLAEESVKYAADILPLVENVSLDTVWLGLRARGDGKRFGADRSSDVLISATGATGPGAIFGYLTGTFGQTEIYLDSSDGFNAADGYKDDTAILPADAHTHMSWVFTEPGVYTLSLQSALRVDDTSRPIPLGEATYTFAVGVEPSSAVPGAVVLDEGHADLTAELAEAPMGVLYDPEGGGEATQRFYTADEVVISVPAKAIEEIPSGQQYRFLGRAGTQVYQLPQAVLGKHVHGEIDPHLWQNVRNVMAYTELIRDVLIEQDPEHARAYRDNAGRYLTELEALDAYVRGTIRRIPAARRYLITTHDAFGYLADAYGIKVGGFVTSNPATEPSLAERRRLSETVRALAVPAVFLEPNLKARSSTLTEVAAEQDVQVCPIYGDALDDSVSTYIDMMRFNADSLLACLG